MRTTLAMVSIFTLVACNASRAEISCSQCTRMEAEASRSCAAIREADRYNYCMRQVMDAGGRCWKVCINYNGLRPAPR